MLRTHHRDNRWLFGAAALILAMFTTVAAPSARTYAAVGDIVVTSPVDAADPNPSDGVCSSPMGCTLRAAIQTANANADHNTIILPPGTYTLALAGTFEDNAATGDLDILHDVTIVGSNNNPEANASATIVEAGSVPKGGIDRVFHVNPNGSGAAKATFKALTIRNGSAPGTGDTGYGGGLSFETSGNTSSLTLYNVVVDNNKTAGQTNMAGGAGGGIDLYNFSSTTPATVLIEKSTISNNQTTMAHGGGISVVGIALTIRDSTISGNVATWSTGTSSGGGIYVQGASSSLTIERSHFFNNRSNDRGEGGAIASSGAAVVVKSSTFNGNVAVYDGGAIHFAAGSLTLANVTMTANQADRNGGGLFFSSGTASLTNTIVFGNSSPGSDEIQGTVSGSNNIVGTDGTGGLTNGVNGNKVGVNPMLSSLGDWGGWTKSYKLLPNSPAIEAGTNTGAPTTDQRGFSRPADTADTDATAVADIGAYEVHPSISDIGNQTGAATVPLPVSFYVGDSAQGLSISATSSNQSVVPNGNLVISNGNTHHPTLTVTGTSVGAATITVTVSDVDPRGQAWSEMDTFTMTVTAPPNAQPPTVGGATTTLEDTQSAAITLTPQAADTTVTHLKITAITNGKLYKSDGTTEITNGTFITKAEGAAGLKFTPTAQFYGIGSFAAQAAYDAAGTGLSTSATASIAVTAVNDPPSFTPGANQTVNEDAGPQAVATWATDISAGPNEPTQSVSFTVSNNNTGLFSVQPAVSSNGTLTFTPAADANGLATVTVKANDGQAANNESAPQTFTITVVAVNDPPVGVTDTGSAVLEDSGQFSIAFPSLLGNDSKGPADENSQTLTITGVTPGVGGTVSISGSYVLFQPTANFHGNATFTYTVQDSGGASATGAVTVPVTPVADTPSVTATTTSEDTQTTTGLVISRNAVDGSEVTHFKISSIAGGALFQSNGTTPITNDTFITYAQGQAGLKFTPDPDLNSELNTFGFTVSAATSAAGAGLSGSATATITVTAVNDAPTAADDTLAVRAEDSGPWTIPFADLTGNDSKGPANESSQTLTITGVSNPIGGTVAIVGEDVIFTPTANWNGTAGFTYTLQDSGAAPNTDTVAVSFTVTEVNDTPEGADDTLAAVDEDPPARTIPFAALLANDEPGPAGAIGEDGQELTITAVGNPVGGSVAIVGTDVVFTLDANFTGTASFTYTVKDNGTTNGAPDPKSDDVTVNFTVNNIAEAPSATAATTAEETKSADGLVITPNAADGGAVTHFFIGGITGGWLYKNDGTTLITNGTSITAAEGAAGLKFMPLSDLNTAEAGDTFEFTVAAALDAAGTGMSPGTLVTITVTEVNDAPTGADDNPPGAITEDYGTLTFNGADLLANDSKGPANENTQTLSITAVDSVIGGTANVVGGDVVFTTAANFAGTASFRYALTDNGTTNGSADSKSSTATVTFTITPVPDAPQITADATDEDELATVVIQRNAVDLAGDVTHFEVTGWTGGVLYLGGVPLSVGDKVTAAEALAGLTFAPTPDKNSDADGAGYFSVKFKAHDSSRNVTGPESTFTITVNQVNDAPTANPETLDPVAEDSAALPIAAATLTANDLTGPANESGQSLTVTAVTAVTGGTVTLDAGTQVITFTPEADFFGTATFNYTVADDGVTNGSADPKASTATVSIPVAARVDVPSVTAVTTAEDTQSPLITITRHPKDTAEVTGYQIDSITNGTLYHADGTTPVAAGTTITYAEGTAGLRFKPAADLNTPAGDNFSVTVKAHSTTGAGTSGPVTATITVTAVNDDPVGGPDTLDAIAEDSGDLTIPFADLLNNDAPGPITADDEDGQTLDIDAVANGTGGTVTIVGNDVVFTTEDDFNGTATFTYTLKDSAGGTTNVTVTIPVTPVADAPWVDIVDIVEDTQSALMPINAFDVETTHFLITNIVGGKLYKADGTTEITNGTYLTVAEGLAGVKFTPAQDQHEDGDPTTFNFSFTATSSTSATAAGLGEETFTPLSVSEVNDAPVAAGDTLSTVAEDSGARTIPFADLTGNDSAGPDNEDGQTLTVASVDNAVGGTVSISGTDVIFTPGADFNGTASFTYKVSDNGTTNGAADLKESAASATVTFSVTAVNDAPVGVADTLSMVEEDSAPREIPFADLLGNDQPGPGTATDESSQTLTITAVSGEVGGTAALDELNQKITFTLDPNFSGTASFTYTVEDNGTPALTHTATVDFPVNPSAEVPSIAPATTAEGTLSAADLTITPDAADGGAVTHFLITGITGGWLYHKDGTTLITNGTYITSAQGADGLRFKPVDFLNTPAGDTFAFTVQAALSGAGAGLSPAITGTVTVTEVNNAPTGAADDLTADADYTVAEDSAAKTFLAADLVANDSKGPANESSQTLTITAADTAVGGTVKVEGGNVVFTPTANFNGTASFRYTLTDNGTTAGAADPRTSTANVTFTITPVPDVPRISGAATAEDTRSGPDLVIQPHVDDDPADVTDYIISNITGGTLFKKDGTPLAVNDVITAAEGAEGLRFTPAQDANDDNGTFSIEVKAHDSSLNRTGLAGTAGINVSEVNDDPIGTDDTLPTVLEDSATQTFPYATFLANDKPGPDTATDEAGQTLTISAVLAGTGVSVVRDTLAGTVKVTPLPNFHGTASFTYTVEDSGTTAGGAAPKTDTVTVTFEVTPVADTPDISPATTDEETQSTSGLVITRNAVDSTEVTHFQITGITGGTLYQNNGTTVIANNSYITAAQAGAGLKFTPNADLNTPAGNTFTFTVKAALDGVGTGLSATGATASITVREVNDLPTGSADTLGDVAEDSGPWTIPFAALTGNDSSGPANESGQALTVASAGSAVGGTVAITGTDVIFTPDTHFNGTASFTYMVKDNGTTNGAADAKTAAAATAVTFTVTEVNDAPVAADDPQPTVAEDSAPVIISIAGLLANDSTGPANEAGQTKTLSAAYGFTGGTITGNDGTNITFTLAPNFHGTAGFTYVVTDNGTTAGAAAALTDTAEVRFTVTPVADTPSISPTTTDEDTQSTTGLVISRNTADGAEVTHFKITAITGGSVYLSDGTTMVPDNGFITEAEGAAGLKFTPLPNRNSVVGQTFAFTVQAALDNAGAAISGGVQADITVREVNDPPVGADDTLVDPATFIEDTGPWIIPAATLLGNDNKGQPNESGQTLTIIAADNAVGGTVAVTAGGDIRFTPSANHDVAASFRYTLRDNGKTGVADDFLTSTATVNFTISPVPDVPRIAGATTNEDTQTGPDLVIQPHLDDDSADITDYIISNITGGTLFKKDGTPLAVNDVITAAEGAEGLRFTPAEDANDDNGTFSIEVKAHDSNLNRTGLAGTAVIIVSEVNDNPIGAPDTLSTVLEDSATRTFPYATFLANDKPGPDTATDEAGQALTISAVTAVTGVSVERDTLAGTVKVTPLANFHGTASFTYTVTDDGTTDGAANPKTDTVTVTFVVTPVADTPDISPATTDEETQSTSGLVITRNAVDSTEVTHFQITGITGGTLYQSNGTTVIADNSYITAAQAGAGLKFTPADHLNTLAGNSFTFTVKAALDNAGTGLSATGANASITVREVNDRPTGAADTLSARAEDSGARTIPFSALTDNDDPGTNEGTQTLTVASVSDPVGGTVALSGTGPDVIFTPDADFNGTASFKYVVRDNGTTRGGADNLNALAATTVTFTITEVNDAPEGTDDPLGTVAEDHPVPGLISIAELLSNDSKGPANESGQTLSITDITDIVGLDVLNDGVNITWTYNANFHGTAGFTYELTDNGTTGGADAKLSDTARVSITVTPVADTPSVTSATTLEEDQTTDGLKISRNSADGTEVTHFRISGITNGTLYHNDGTTPIGEGTYITYAEGAAGLKFTPVANRNNQAGDSFRFTVEAALDELGTGLSPATVVSITVNEKNDPPVGADDTLVDPDTFIEDTGPWIIPAATLLGNDNKGQPNESGQTLTIIAADNAVGGTVAVTAGGDIRFTPSANHDDAASFRYTLRDNGKTGVADDFLTSTATVNFTISPVPDVPRIAGATTNEDTQTGPDLVIQPHVDDDDADVTDYIISNITGGTLYKKDGTPLAVNAVITAAEGAEGLRFTPAEDANRHNATFSIEVKAHDSSLNRTGPAGTAAVTVKEVNDAPVGAADTLDAVAEDSATRTFPYAIFLANDKPGPDTATDEAGQTLTISAVTAGTGVSVERDTVAGTVKVTPLPDFNGTASFTYTVTDDGITDTAADPQSQTVTVTFTVTEVNDHPIATDDPLPATDEDTPLTVAVATLLANDKAGPDDNEDGQHLSITDLVSDPTIGDVAFDENDPTTIIFTPVLNYHGPASFTYTVTDDGTNAGASAALTDTAVASFTVNPVNDAPVAADKNLSVIVGSTARSSVSATDVENNPLTYAVVDAPAKGTVTMAPDGTFEYTAVALGTFTLTYKANDGTADSNLAMVTIAVHPVPIVPIVSISAPVTVTREERIVVTGMANPGYYVTVGGTTVQADGSGNWSATVALVEGPNVITATNGPATASVTVTRDTKPPVITLTAPAERTDEESILLTATSEEGAKITIEGQEGATLTVSLKMGMNRFSATATDLAGNQGTATVSVIRVGKVPAKVEIEPGKPGEVRMLNFKVEVPGEAVPQAITLEILSPSADTEAVKQAAGAAIVAVTGDADASGREDGKPVHGLDDEATVTFTYDPAQVASPEKLRIYYFDPKLKVWVELGGAVDRKTNTITVQVEHFTTFAAMEPRTDAPVLSEPPAEVREESLTVTGTYLPKTQVWLIINSAVQATATTDAEGRFTLTGKLAEGRNWVYVKGTGILASREMTVHYQPVGYTDIGGHWAEAQIKALAKRGVVSLYPEPLFLPEEKVTRLEFAVMVARVLGLAPVDEAPSFTDTDTMPAWALPEMTAAVKAGIIKGMPDGSFAPFNLVTRAEMAIMLTRALSYKGMDITPGDKAFTDAEQIPVWAKDQVLTAARYGLITGYPDGSFQSGNSTTRAEAVTMLNRLLNLISGQQ